MPHPPTLGRRQPICTGLLFVGLASIAAIACSSSALPEPSTSAPPSSSTAPSPASEAASSIGSETSAPSTTTSQALEEARAFGMQGLLSNEGPVRLTVVRVEGDVQRDDQPLYNFASTLPCEPPTEGAVSFDLSLTIAASGEATEVSARPREAKGAAAPAAANLVPCVESAARKIRFPKDDVVTKYQVVLGIDAAGASQGAVPGAKP